MTEWLAPAESPNKCQITLEEAEKARPRSDNMLPKSFLAKEQLPAYLRDDVEGSQNTVKVPVEIDQRLG